MISKKSLSLLRLSYSSSTFSTFTKWIFCKQVNYIYHRSSKHFNTPYCPQLPQPLHRVHNQVVDINAKKLNELSEKEYAYHRGLEQFEIATKAQQQLINDFICGKTEASTDEWNRLLQDVSNVEYGRLNANNIHVTIVNHCKLTHNVNLAKNYLKFMKETGKKYNQVLVMEFIKLCYGCETSLTEEDRKTVQIFTNMLLSKSSIMENKLCGAVVRGLSVMNDWKRCVEVVEKLKENYSVDPTIYITLILCLLHNDQFQLARDKLLECLGNKHTIHHCVYLKWIDTCQKDSNKLQDLLVIFRDYNIIPNESVCKRLVEAFSQLPPEKRLRGEFTSIHHGGKCKACKQNLVENILSYDEFQELRDEFLNRVLVGTDIFKNTTPMELKRFFKFVKLKAPFDVVIDGLNVIFHQGNDKPRSVKARYLADCVDYFYRRDKKVLVIGRQHIGNLPTKILENVYEKSALFLINDLSEDDPFTIYATLSSGPRCVFVTKDFMRSEKFRLSDDRLCDLFKRWQLSHQLVPKSISNVDFKLPLSFKICVQDISAQSWHIPYRKDDDGSDIYDENNLTNWLCLRR